MEADAPQLTRRIGPVLLTLYGVGVMVGAGIYVLIGTIAGLAGVWAPIVFLLAGLIAAPSALSYAELASRMPEAAGEAIYVEKGLRSHALGQVVGLAIVVAGTVSAAAVLRGGTGYLLGLANVPFAPSLVVIGAALTLVAILGALESLALAAVFTVVEVAGLVLVMWAGLTAQPVADWQIPAAPVLTGIGAATALAFFAFIGFEDIVNMAEEVREPERALPRAILWSLAITAVLYAIVAVAAVRAVPVAELARSDRPLALVWQEGSGQSAAFLSGIAVLAALNGVLAQIVMASRVLFGLGKRSAALRLFHRTHRRFGTPVRATLLTGGAVIAAALILPVGALAEVTVLVLLVIFLMINAALIAAKRSAPGAPFRVPNWVPWAGIAASVAALAAAVAERLT